MLKHSDPFSRPVDIDMQHIWEHKCKILGVLNNPFTHMDGESDLKGIGNRDKTKRRPLIQLVNVVYEKIMFFSLSKSLKDSFRFMTILSTFQKFQSLLFVLTN